MNLIENILSLDIAQKQEIARELANSFGVRHATYFGMNLPGGNGFNVCAITTYPPQWHDHYFANRYEDIDPVVSLARRRLLPLDWDEINKESATIKNFFGEATDHGICQRGLTLPIRGAYNEFALVTLNTDMSVREWNLFKKSKLPDLYVRAYEFHTAIVANFNPKDDTISLSPRQREVLYWASEGKTVWETGRICSLEPRTVRFHLDQAMRKLSVYSKVQAVAKAAKCGLV